MATTAAPNLAAALAEVQSARAAERAQLHEDFVILYKPRDVAERAAIEHLANAHFRSFCLADVEMKILLDAEPRLATLKLFLRYQTLAERQLQTATRRMDKLLRERTVQEKEEAAQGSWRTRGEQHSIIELPRDETTGAGALCLALNEALLQSQTESKPVRVDFGASERTNSPPSSLDRIHPGA